MEHGDGTAMTMGATAGAPAAGGWEDFEARLAWSLRELPERAFLVVERDLPDNPDGSHFVQLARTRPGILAEAVSNLYLRGARRLDGDQDGRLAGLGWEAPRPRSKHRRNWRRTWDVPVPFTEVAALAVRTLREVYGAGSPSELRYLRFLRKGGPLPDPGLGIALLEPAAPAPREGAREEDDQVALGDALRKLDGATGLAGPVDEEWTFAFDGAKLRARPMGGPFALARVYSVVVRDVAPTPGLLHGLNAMNVKVIAGRVLWHDGAVIVAMDVPARPVEQRALEFACGLVAGVRRHVMDEVAPHLRPRSFDPEPDVRLN